MARSLSGGGALRQCPLTSQGRSLPTWALIAPGASMLLNPTTRRAGLWGRGGGFEHACMARLGCRSAAGPGSGPPSPSPPPPARLSPTPPTHTPSPPFSPPHPGAGLAPGHAGDDRVVVLRLQPPWLRSLWLGQGAAQVAQGTGGRQQQRCPPYMEGPRADRKGARAADGGWEWGAKRLPPLPFSADMGRGGGLGEAARDDLFPQIVDGSRLGCTCSPAQGWLTAPSPLRACVRACK